MKCSNLGQKEGKKRTERKDGKISKGEIKGHTVADMGGKEHRHPHEQT